MADVGSKLLVVTDNDGLPDSTSQTFDLTNPGGTGDGTPPIQDGTGGSGTPTAPIDSATIIAIKSGFSLAGKVFFETGDPPAPTLIPAFAAIGYPDAGWAAPVLACPTIGAVYPPGTEPISYTVSCSCPNGTMYVRYHFTLDSGLIRSTSIVVEGDDHFGIWINGVWLFGGDTGVGTHADDNFLAFLHPGDNVLAIAVNNTGGGGHNIAFDLEIHP